MEAVLTVQLPRSSGIVLHPTSLPDGRLAASAYEFVDWLEAAGQSWWQVLPLGPPDEVGSPYASESAFAAWSGFLAEPNARVTKLERAVSGRSTRSGLATGRSGAATSPTRCASSASGRRSGSTPARAGSG